jgi:hydroxyacylglutathione hydrolase
VVQEIKRLNYFKVNCYLIKTDGGFYLIDTGYSHERFRLEKDLTDSGCRPGDLRLIILTHGDFDHTGNAAYFRQKYRGRIAMHPSETEVVRQGDILASRKPQRRLVKIFSRMALMIVLPIMQMGNFEKFQPDLEVEEGYDLSGSGFEAKILHLPGHSRGSIGILTASGDLFCGDLLVGGEQPALNSLIDDPPTAQASLRRLKKLNLNVIYPGHGRPFTRDKLPARSGQ